MLYSVVLVQAFPQKYVYLALENSSSTLFYKILYHSSLQIFLQTPLLHKTLCEAHDLYEKRLILCKYDGILLLKDEKEQSNLLHQKELRQVYLL